MTEDISFYGLEPANSRTLVAGQRFGRLVIISFGKKGRRVIHALCQCDCGNFCAPVVSNMRRGTTTSCGCFRSEQKAEIGRAAKTTHGLSRVPLYSVWRGMMHRCYDASHIHYHRYGGRGINVCDKWKIPKFFIEDMSPTYSKGLTLDRIDNDGPYEPGNCRWATPEQQNSNKSNNVYFTHDGQTLTISQWGRMWNVTRSAAGKRIHKLIG